MPRPHMILDTQHEFENGMIYRGKSKGCGGNPVREWVQLMEEGRPAVLKAGAHIIRPTRMRADVREAQYMDFLNVVNEAGFSGTVVLDESDLYCPNGNAVRPVRDMIYRGRHFNQSLVFSCKRLATIDKAIINNAHCVVSFRQQVDVDIRRFKYMFDNGEIVANLDASRHEYAVFGQRFREVPYFENLAPQNI